MENRSMFFIVLLYFCFLIFIANGQGNDKACHDQYGCESYQTCCLVGANTYGCCPYAYGNCCDGTALCCQSGFICVSRNETEAADTTNTHTCRRKAI